MGWHWVGRLRHTTLVKPVEVPDRDEEWVPSRALHVLAGEVPRDMGLMHTVRSAPWACRLVAYAKAPQGRKHRNRRDRTQVARSSSSRKAAAREREPWLIVASPELTHLSVRQLVTLYARRMQIELSFRDLKSHRYGQGFEDSLTRSGPRIEILLLINALAAFASWLVGMACEAAGLAHWLSPARSKRKLYSTLRIGREALVRQWPMERTSQWLERLQRLPDAVQQQMTAPG